MSCFIVEDETINKAITALIKHEDETKHNGLTLSNTGFSLSALGQAMLTLNEIAYTKRYGENPVDDLPYQGFKLIRCTDVEAFKAIECWLYQCDEGESNTNTDPLFLFFDKFLNFLARKIVQSLTEYENANRN